MYENINDGTYSECSGTHKDHGPWVPGTHKEVNNFESVWQCFMEAIFVDINSCYLDKPYGISNSAIIGHHNRLWNSIRNIFY